jgi:GNAT superfamily N-acetyltransferase
MAQGAVPRQAVAWNEQASAMFMLHSSNVQLSPLKRASFTMKDYLLAMDDLIRDRQSEMAEGGEGESAERTLPGTIRKLWVGETNTFRDHLLRLDPDSRRSRFGSPVNNFFIDQYASRALTPESVVHGLFVDGTLRAAAELRIFGKPFPYDAEAAFSVERAWQSRGVGSELLERTILAAQNRSIRTIYLNCLAENRRMQAIAKKHEASLQFRADEVIGEVVNPGATPLSLAREFMADGYGMATAILDLQSRMFRHA